MAELVNYMGMMLRTGQGMIFSRSDRPNTYAIAAFALMPREISGSSELNIEDVVSFVCRYPDALQVIHTWSCELPKVVQLREVVKTLSNGHKKVLESSLKGIPNKAIASRLDVSERTVETRRQDIVKQLGARCMAEVAQSIFETIGIAEIISED